MAIFRAIGAYVQRMDKSVGYDLMVHYSNRSYPVEIKSVKGKLTRNEHKVKAAIEEARAIYHIIRTPYEAIRMFGLAPIWLETSQLITISKLDISDKDFMRHIFDEIKRRQGAS